MIFAPVILPQVPNPSVSECEILISYITEVISGLEAVENRLNEVSYNPDDGIKEVRKNVTEMRSGARTTKSHLQEIKSNAYEKMNIYNQSSSMV